MIKRLVNNIFLDTYFLFFIVIILLVITAKHTIFSKNSASEKYHTPLMMDNKRESPVNHNIADTSILYGKNVYSGSKVVILANKYLNTPYVKGGKNWRGFDCSGFVHFIYKKAGCKVPGNTFSLSKCGKEIPLDESKKGDLIFFEGISNEIPSHVGIIAGNPDKYLSFIHASSSRGIQKDTLLKSEYFKERFVKVKRLIKK